MSEQDKGYVVRAARWHHGAACSQITEEALIKELHDGGAGVLWAHVDVQDAEKGFEFLAGKLGFHPVEVEDSVSDQERPGLHERENGLFLVAPVLEGAGDQPCKEIGFFLGSNYLISVSTRPLPVIDEWMGRWKSRPEEVGSSSGHLLHALLDAIVDDYFPVVDRLEDEIDELESQIFRGLAFDVREGLAFKRRVLELRRQVGPLRDVINGLLRRDMIFIPAEVRPYLQDVYDHTLRVLENLDINRDILSSILDAHLSLTSNRLSEVMRIMTVLATILMTDALIAGIYGMNFDFMPELNWWLGYPFALLLMLTASIAEWLLFKKKGWV